MTHTHTHTHTHIVYALHSLSLPLVLGRLHDLHDLCLCLLILSSVARVEGMALQQWPRLRHCSQHEQICKVQILQPYWTYRTDGGEGRGGEGRVVWHAVNSVQHACTPWLLVVVASNRRTNSFKLGPNLGSSDFSPVHADTVRVNHCHRLP